MASKEQFVGYTNGLVCNGFMQLNKLVKVEISKSESDYVLQPVSGENLAQQAGRTHVDAKRFESIEKDPYNTAAYAKTLLAICGWEA